MKRRHRWMAGLAATALSMALVPVVAAPAGAETPIDAKYAELGGESGILGPPTAAEADIAGGRYRTYQRGDIYWSTATGAHEVHGDILRRYRGQGGPGGRLGFPATDEVVARDGRVNRFKGGHLYWSPRVGVRMVVGSILVRYLEMGGPGGRLGLPTTDEMAVPGGRATHFDRGNIYWGPGIGPRVVEGSILQRYLQVGGPAAFGLPTTDEVAVPGGRLSSFERANIYWGPTIGPRLVYGAILQQYLALGATASYLGLPFTDELPHPRGRVSYFLGGQIHWSPSVGVRASPPLPAGSGSGRRVVYANRAQRVWLVEADGRVSRSYLVSGRAGMPSPGAYRVYSRSRYSSSGSVTMEFMIRFAYGSSLAIGFHGIPVGSSGPIQSESELGQYRSHGCVRQAVYDAAHLWDWAPIDTPVVVLA